mmetsp:Transcript_14686/g.41032  ORF Transcript_14686/g.41032 Transcript_14686/m.41032 type:complete len:93 (-) Transcript_14686:970-1248(-)
MRVVGKLELAHFELCTAAMRMSSILFVITLIDGPCPCVRVGASATSIARKAPIEAVFCECHLLPLAHHSCPPTRLRMSIVHLQLLTSMHLFY